jgi:MFS family permease
VLAFELVALAAVGWASVTFIATGNTTLQLQTEPTMRGRVMSLWAVAFQGTTPIGGPLIGWVVAMAGARIGLGVGAVACLVAAGIGGIAMAKLGILRGRSRSGHEAPGREGPAAEAPLGLVAEGD